MADDSRMVGQANIIRVMTASIRARRRAVRIAVLLVDNKGALDIYLHRARVNDSVVDLGGVCACSETGL